MASKPKAAAAQQPEHPDPTSGAPASPPPPPAAKTEAKGNVVPLRKPNLLQRLNAAQQEVDYVQKEKRQGMRYSIVSHDAVTGKVRPVLVKHGVLYYPVTLTRAQVGNRTECEMGVRFVNIDDPADFIDVPTFGYGIDDQDKGPGKAMSYAVKYALLKALGMETGDDPDLEQDQKHEEREPGAKPQPQGNGSGNGKSQAPDAAKKQRDEDAAYVDGLVLRMVKMTSKDELTKLHQDTKPRRSEIAERSPEIYQVYLDAMKQRAAEIDAGQAGGQQAA